MNRHLPMLFVATLSMGGCHRTEPASKATGGGVPIRSTKEVKPIVISVSPDPPATPVFIRKRGAETSLPNAPLARISSEQSRASHSAEQKPKQYAVPSTSLSQPEGAGRKVFSSQVKGKGDEGKGDEGKGDGQKTGSGSSRPVASTDSAIPMQKATTGRFGSSKSPIPPVREGRRPWERPLQSPASASGLKASNAKEAGSSKAIVQKPSEVLPPAVQWKSSDKKEGETVQVLNTSSLASGTSVVTSLAPVSVSPSPVQGGSKADDPAADGDKVAQKPLEGGQKEEQKLGEKSAPLVAEKEAKTASKTGAEGAPALEKREDQPQQPVTSVESQAAPISLAAGPQVANSQNDGEQAGKPAAKIPAASPKKLSEVDRREEIRRQATESFRSGQQLIRESRNAEAMQAFKQSVKLMPGSADAWLRIAFLLEREGNLEEARRAFREAKKLWSF